MTASDDLGGAGARALETAIFGGGCFWCLEAVFSEVAGVHAVTSGYCGGELAEPSYAAVCSGQSGHAEVVKIDFDPAEIRFVDLLDIFFAIHDPTTPDRQGNDVGPQYRSVIFATSDLQREQALVRIAELEAEQVFAEAIVTTVELAPRFWPAESEHRHYFARHSGQPYCRFVIAPKLAAFRTRFAHRRRGGSANE